MNRYRTVRRLLFVTLALSLLMGLSPAWAQGGLPGFVPDDAEYGLPDLSGRELNNLDAWWVIENPDPDATTTRVLFDRVALRDGDVVTIMDVEGRIYQTFGALVCPETESDGSPCPSASVAVPGDTLLLHMETVGRHGTRDAFRASAVEAGVAIFTGPQPPRGYRVIQVVREQSGMPIDQADAPQQFNWHVTAYLYVPEEMPTGEPVDVIVDIVPLGPHLAPDTWTLDADIFSAGATGSVVFAYDARAATQPHRATWEWVYVDPDTGERRTEVLTAPGGAENEFLARRDDSMLSIVYQALKDGATARDLLDVMFDPAGDALNDLYVLGLLQGDSEAPGTFTLATSDYTLTELLIPPVPYLERVRFTLPLLFEEATALPLQVYAKVKSLRAVDYALGLAVYPWYAKFSVPLFAGSEPPSALPGRIAFVSDRDGNPDIYTMNTDGSDVRRLTDDPAEDQGPVWSPDGTQIAFHSYRSGNWDIYVMDADGGNVRPLTDSSATDSNASWSPDGTQIVFHSNRTGRWHIYMLDIARGNITRLTRGTDGYDSPDWSPDGTQIALSSDQAGNWDVYVMDADGGHMVQLTDDPDTESTVAWSPDGTQIAFHSPREGDWNIYTVAADGSEQQRLTDSTGDDARPAWSPDGRHIVFDSNRSGNYEIYIMDADGGNVVQVTDDPAYDREADWWMPAGALRPSAGRIAFVSDRADGFEVYAMDVDGGNLTRLTDNAGIDSWPVWSPDGTRIAFHSFVEDMSGEIYVMDADGGSLTRLTDSPGADMYPAWSPDGTQMVFQSSRNGNYDLYVMDADGGNVAQLTDDEATDTYPQWSPDGTRILFQSSRDGVANFFVMDTDGRRVQRLTRGDVAKESPKWSPDRTQIVFHSYAEDVPAPEIFVMDADGGNVTRVTFNNENDFFASWTGDGRILFSTNRDGDSEAYIMEADGSGQTNLTNSPAAEWYPVWQPGSAE